MKIDEMTSTLIELQNLVEQLRDPKNGDPWILAQDFKSLIDLTIEEAYELADAVERGVSADTCDELGDLILHIFLYAKIADESGKFNLIDVVKHTIEKQNSRKLYFKNPEKISAEEALMQWEDNKRKEREVAADKKSQSQSKYDSDREKTHMSALDGITCSIPSINRALILQSQAARVGFDWPTVEPVFEKLEEELTEVKEVLEEQEKQETSDILSDEIKNRLTDEVGDLLFTCVNIARHFNIHPELALRQANRKFEKRFREVELELLKKGKKPEESTLEEMSKMWKKVKKSL